LALGLGYLSSLWDNERRTWHDRLAGTRVVRR
ncbi:MAG: RDD family protein, partial [Chloroflexi bacterium]|nr:RDD family protein [Chloroflexota bacterium]